MRRKFLSGFGGSAGTAVVTQDDALLWTDSRYWNEANLQLDSSLWTLMKAGQPKVPKIPNYLGDLAAKHYTDKKSPLVVGIDPFVHPASFKKELADAFDEAAKTELTVSVNGDSSDDDAVEIGKLDTSNPNLIDPIWGDARPEIPYSPFRVHPLEFAGVSVQDKVSKIRKEMETKRATLSVFCTLDDVAYLLNVRAMGDVDTCPVGIAYATVSKDTVTLYCDKRKVQSPEVSQHLSDVVIKPYEEIVKDIEEHCKGDPKTSKVWIDASRANYALVNVVPKKALLDSQNAITPMKACKNNAELKGMRKAHIVDGVAYAKFMAEMEERIAVNGQSISEVELDEVLTGYRSEQEGFMECSFPTIAGVGSNAAIIHYRAKEDDIMKHWDSKNPILIDSGGQYTYGTTDVTRTWHLGQATDEFRDYYTRVLKGNIGVDTMIFPEDTPGLVLDVFARKALWEAGKDYGHGTGHGVGAALNVHEGPFSISPRFTNLEGLKRGMVVSNEPGYYEDGNLGIRIENLLEISYVKDEDNEEAERLAAVELLGDVGGDEKKEDPPKSSDKKYLKFAKLTMIPIQKNLIKVELMTDSELDWLDAYHQEILGKVGPLLEPGSPAMKWLQKSCEKIDRSKST